MQRFSGRVALITGAGSGIGRAAAVRLAAEGAALGLLDVDADGLAATFDLLDVDADGLAATLDPIEARVTTHVVDVADPSAVTAAVDAVVAAHGRLDVAVANAGIVVEGTAQTHTLAEWRRVTTVNVDGIFHTLRSVLPHMLRAGAGAVVTTGSTAGIISEPNHFAYSTSKSSVIGLTRAFALDVARLGIRANTVCPGWIDTGFGGASAATMPRTERAAIVGRRIPMGRQGRAEEVAAAIAFLASDDASFVTGHALVVDGGMTAN